MSYRIKHKPTGLYFCPSRSVKDEHGNYVKSNLSDKGKLYHRYPSLDWCLGKIATHVYDWDFIGTERNGKILAESTVHDWEIEEMGAPPPKRPQGASDEEWAIQIGTQAALEHLKATFRSDASHEEANNTLQQAMHLGLKAMHAACKEFKLDGAL